MENLALGCLALGITGYCFRQSLQRFGLRLGLFFLKSYYPQKSIGQSEHVQGNIYRVPYIHDDREYYLYFTIDPRLKQKQLENPVLVHLITADNYISLTQQLGVPYSIKPSDGGFGTQIEVYSEDLDRVVRLYRDNDKFEEF